MKKSSRIIVPEFDMINSDISNDSSYVESLDDCLFTKKMSFNKGNLIDWGHASKGAGECYRRLGLHEKAADEYKHAFGAFKEEKDYKSLAWTMWAQGNLFRQKCNYHDAYKSLIEAYNISYKYKYIRCMAYALAGIAETTRIIGNYNLSLIQHYDAFILFKILKDLRGYVWYYEGVAQIFKNANFLQKSLKYFSVAKKISESTNDYRGLAFAYKGLGEILGYLNNYFDSIHYFESAILIFSNIHYKIGEAYSFKSYGEMELSKGNLSESIRLLREAENIFLSVSDKRGENFVMKTLGDYYRKINNKEEAIQLYTKAYNFFNDFNIYFGKNITYKAIVNLGV